MDREEYAEALKMESRIFNGIAQSQIEVTRFIPPASPGATTRPVNNKRIITIIICLSLFSGTMVAAGIYAFLNKFNIATSLRDFLDPAIACLGSWCGSIYDDKYFAEPRYQEPRYQEYISTANTTAATVATTDSLNNREWDNLVQAIRALEDEEEHP